MLGKHANCQNPSQAEPPSPSELTIFSFIKRASVLNRQDSGGAFVICFSAWHVDFEVQYQSGRIFIMLFYQEKELYYLGAYLQEKHVLRSVFNAWRHIQTHKQNVQYAQLQVHRVDWLCIHINQLSIQRLYTFKMTFIVSVRLSSPCIHLLILLFRTFVDPWSIWLFLTSCSNIWLKC